MKPALVISDRDNVATALEPLEPGRGARGRAATVTVREAIPSRPQGRARAIAAGERGHQVRQPDRHWPAPTSRAGAHVHTHNVSSSRGRGDLERRRPRRAEPRALGRRSRLAEPPDDRDGRHAGAGDPVTHHGTTLTNARAFSAIRRPDGRVGTRNHVLVVPTVICSAVVAERVAASAAPVGAALPHLAGCGQLGPDMRVTHETLAAYCAHPNVGAVLVIALGCEQVVAQMLADAARRHGKPAEIIAIQSEGGTVRTTEKGIAHRAGVGGDAGRRRSASGATSSELVLSLKCGGSDYTSGLASNPALGRVTDRLVDLGGSAVLGEDRRDHGRRAPAGRARDAARAAHAADSDHRRASRSEARALGLDIRGTQPSPGNIRGGLTTIEEKSLGATHKGGERAPLEDVVPLCGAASRRRG